MQKENIDRPFLYTYFLSTSNVLLAEYERSKNQKSSANLGRNRESFCKNFLEKSLPPKLSIRSGEIWDSKRHKTGQLDVIILRDDAPSLNIGTDDVFLAEGVFGVIEVKSNLTRDKFKEAGKSMEKVAELNIESGIAIASGPVLDRPIRIIFSYEGASWDIITNEIKKNNWIDLFDMICILNRGILLRNGKIIRWDGENPYSAMDGKASALGFLYMYIVTYSGSFLGRNLSIQQYFEPINNWRD